MPWGVGLEKRWGGQGWLAGGWCSHGSHGSAWHACCSWHMCHRGSAWHAHDQLVALGTCGTEGSAWHAHAQLVALGTCVTWLCLGMLVALGPCVTWLCLACTCSLLLLLAMCHIWLCLACTCSACCSWHMGDMALPGMHMLNLCHMALPGMHMLSLAIPRLRPPTSSRQATLQAMACSTDPDPPLGGHVPPGEACPQQDLQRPPAP